MVEQVEQVEQVVWTVWTVWMVVGGHCDENQRDASWDDGIRCFVFVYLLTCGKCEFTSREGAMHNVVVGVGRRDTKMTKLRAPLCSFAPFQEASSHTN